MLHVHKEKGYKDKEANEQSWGGKGHFIEEKYHSYIQKPRKFRIL